MFGNKLTGEGVSFITSNFELSDINAESSHLEIHAANMLEKVFIFLVPLGKSFLSLSDTVADIKYILSIMPKVFLFCIFKILSVQPPINKY